MHSELWRSWKVIFHMFYQSQKTKVTHLFPGVFNLHAKLQANTDIIYKRDWAQGEFFKRLICLHEAQNQTAVMWHEAGIAISVCVRHAVLY